MAETSFQTTPGALDPGALTANAPVVDAAALKPEPIDVRDAEVFHVMVEVDERLVVPFMPPALHVPLPPMVTFVLWVCHESSVGPFNLGMVRINTRLNARPRGLVLGSYLEGSAEAADRLRTHWGFDIRPGKIAVNAYHDEIVGTVEAGGRTILRVSGRDPGPISPEDIRDMPACTPIRLRDENGERSLLLQVDSEFHVRQATRSIHPSLELFEADAWGGANIAQEYPVRALHYSSEFRIVAPRFMIDPALSTYQRSEEIP